MPDPAAPGVIAVPGGSPADDARLAQVKLGATRAEIENVLGRPMSEEERLGPDETGKPGALLVTAVYMVGMPKIDMGSFRAGGGVLGSLASSGLSMASMVAGPAGSLAASLGGSLVGAAESAAAEHEADRMQREMMKVRMFTVTYHDGRVISVQKMRMGAMMGPE